MKPFEQQTYYELLEIPVTAPDAEILAAYERALETYSPDSIAVYALVDPGQIDALRARLTEAMEILTEPDLRTEYDRMIGVSRSEANTAVAPAVAAPAVAAPPEPAVAREASPAPAAVPVPPAPAPEPEPVPQAAVPEPSAAPEQKPPAVEAPPPAVEAPPPAPAPTGVPAGAELPATPVVSPAQIHAAFRSYAISYVPVLVPGPSATGSAFLSPFAVPVQPSAPPAGQEAPREEQAASVSTPPVAASAPEAAAPVSAPVSDPTPAAPVAAEAPAQSTAVAAPVVSPPPAEPAPAPIPAAIVAQAPVEPSLPSEPAHAAPAQPTPAPVAVQDDAEELSGARAPPRPEARPEPRPNAPRPPVAPMGRPHRPTPTPPPLPASRRTTRSTPTVQPRGAAGDEGKSSGRPAQSSGLHLDEAQQLSQESAIATAEAALAQVSAKAREPKPKPIELPPDTEFNGELLRRVRESRGLSLQQLAERTRISSKHIENVEADRYNLLPQTVYLRGMLMSLARELTLDPLRVSKSYLALATAPKKK